MEDEVYIVIHPETKSVLAEVHNDHIDFYDDQLQRAMLLCGINIPQSLKQKYKNRNVLFPGDENFSTAFVEIYFPMALHEAGMILKKK